MHFTSYVEHFYLHPAALENMHRSIRGAFIIQNSYFPVQICRFVNEKIEQYSDRYSCLLINLNFHIIVARDPVPLPVDTVSSVFRKVRVGVFVDVKFW